MKRISTLLMATALAVPAACGGGDGTADDDTNCDPATDPTCTTPGDEWDQQLASREYDYNAALRIAAVRLTGDLPTFAEINEIAGPTDLNVKKGLYNARIADYVSRPTFAKQMMFFWQDTMKIGETPEFDTAPAFAAQLSVTNGDYRQLFTAASGACPTFDGNATFTAGECTGTGPKAGVLGNPGVMKQYYSNFAFRRVKWIEETFDCLKFPVELNGTAQEIGAASPYTGEWPFDSIAGTDSGGRVNFKDVSAVICANCHQTINHIAPLFANYDMNGVYQPQIAVTTPLDGAPLAQLSDYLPAGKQQFAWRFNQPVADIPALGAAMAGDPDIAKCGVARVWNWALGKTDIVDTLQEVPAEVIQTQVDSFTAGGFKMKDMIVAVYTSDDFTKF